LFSITHVNCSLSELVKHDENGLVFDNEKQLANQLMVRI